MNEPMYKSLLSLARDSDGIITNGIDPFHHPGPPVRPADRRAVQVMWGLVDEVTPPHLMARTSHHVAGRRAMHATFQQYSGRHIAGYGVTRVTQRDRCDSA